MNLSTKTLAARWGVTVRAVQYLVAKGLPLTSEQAANRWRRIHANGRRTKRRRTGGQAQTPKDSDPALSVEDKKPITDASSPVSPQADISLDSLTGMLLRTKAAERIAFAALLDARRRNAIEDYKTLVQTHSIASLAVMKAERETQDILVERRVLIPYDDAVSIFSRHLLGIRRHVESMPNHCGPRCNPSDPDGARLVLSEWVENLLRIVSQAENQEEGAT